MCLGANAVVQPLHKLRSTILVNLHGGGSARIDKNLNTVILEANDDYFQAEGLLGIITVVEMSDTIWSSNSDAANVSSQYRNVLDHLEPDFVAYDSGPGSRRLSMNASNDIDKSLFGIKPGPLSAITAPVGGYNGDAKSPNHRLGLGTASISGGIANRHPPQDSFLKKFSSVGEATRDIELSSNLNSLGLDERPRRTSFNQQDLSPNGSLNESLNINRNTSRHQSISEKIDHYNSTSPIQTGATLSIASDLRDSVTAQPNFPQPNFWNPAAATSFTPSFYLAMDGYNYNPYLRTQSHNVALSAPPNAVPAPSNAVPSPSNAGPAPPPSGVAPPPAFLMASPPYQFIDPRMYNMSYPPNDKDQSESEEHSELKKDIPRFSQPGIGLPPRQINSSFMFPTFNPYYQQMSPSIVNNNDDTPPTVTPNHSNPSKTKKKSPRDHKSQPNSKDNGGPHIYRSPLLEEVRSNTKGKEYHLKDIYDHAIEFTKDQHGSRFIQQKLPDATEEEKEVIFNEIRDISYELMTDVFGNYVIQKYFEHGTKTQKYILLDHMIGHIYDLSLQMYGCRVVQRALEAIELEGQLKIINELRDYILICSKDQNGNHVIQKSIERIPFEKVRFILECLENQIYHLSTHPYGCRVIQRLLENSTLEDQKAIMAEFNKYIFYLIQDQYGNYVMQHILERGSKNDREPILKIVLGSVVSFSKHKFASNVIEKCIKCGDLNQRKKILHEVLLGNEDLEVEVVNDDSPLALMMKDQYANYVIQKLVEAFDTKSNEKRLLVLKLRQYLKQISSKNNYGKHLASVEKMIIVAENALIEADNS